MDATQKDLQAVELLDEIKNLKFSNLKREEFWKLFLEDIAKLHKAPFALLLKEEVQEWRLDSAYNLEEFSQDAQEILQLGVSVGIRALKNGFSYERVRAKWSSSNSLMGVAVHMEASDETLILFLCIEHTNTLAFNNSVARLRIFSDVYLAYSIHSSKNLTLVEDKTEVTTTTNTDSFEDVVEIVSLLIYQKKFLLAAMTLTNELSIRFNCSKVSMGWKKSEYVETVAISHREDFTRKSEVVDKLESVFEECFDQGHEIHYPFIEDDFVITYAHDEYLQENRLKDILSLPLRINEEVKGILLFEKQEDEFKEEELVLLRLISNQISPILDSLYVHDRGFFSSLKYKMREYLSWWLGVNDTLMKFAIIVVFVTFIVISTVDMRYKIESLGALTTDNISFVSAPYDSTVYKVEVHSGDLVKKESPLLVLDTKELYLKYTEALADVSRYFLEEQKARGANKLADMQIANAKMNQAVATQQRLEYYLKQSNVTSPIEGVIVEGDYEELLGKPVSKGDMLFKIAQLSDFYLTLNVSEEYINEVEVGSTGEFVFLGKTAEKIAFSVEKIIPIANVDGSKSNSFILKAVLHKSANSWWRPGMSGIAKIDAGDRKIIWVLTHKLVDFLRLFFWI